MIVFQKHFHLEKINLKSAKTFPSFIKKMNLEILVYYCETLR